MMFLSIKGRKAKVFLFALMFLLSSCNNFQDIVTLTPAATTQPPAETITPTEIAATASEEIPEQKIEYIKLIEQIGHGVILDVAWHPDNSKIAVATSQGIRFYDPETLAELDFWNTGEPIFSLVYKSDGTLISSNGHGLITFWDEKGESYCFSTQLDRVCSLVLSPDEKWLAAGSCNIRNQGVKKEPVVIWDIENQKVLGKISTQEKYLVGVTFSQDSNFISLYEYGYGYCSWDLSNLRYPTACIEPFCESPICGPYNVIGSLDGTWIAEEGSFGSVYAKKWDEEEWRYYPVSACDACRAYGLEFSSDSELLAAGVMKNIFIFDVSTGETISQNDQGPAQDITFSPTGETYVAKTRFGKLSLLYSHTGEKLAESNEYWGVPNVVAVSQDQSQFVIGYMSGFIIAWELPSLEFQYAIEIPLAIYNLEYISDGKEILYGGDYRNFFERFNPSRGIISSKNGELIAEIDEELPKWYSMYPSAISLDGRISVSPTGENEISIYDNEVGENLGKFQSQTLKINSLGIAQVGDEYWIIVADSYGLINIWAVKIVED